MNVEEQQQMLIAKIGLPLEDEVFKNGAYYCKKCNSERVIVYGDFIARCLCECQSQERERLESEKALKEYQELQEKRRIYIFGKLDTAKKTFENSTIDNEFVDYCKHYAEDFDKTNNKNLFLYGDMGCGKTYLALAICNFLYTKGLTVKYINCANLSSLYDDLERNEKAIFRKQFVNSDIVCLDDLGTERDSDFIKSKLFDLVNERYERQKPIITTSNIDFKNMDKYGANMTRILSRVMDRTRTKRLNIKGVKR